MPKAKKDNFRVSVKSPPNYIMPHFFVELEQQRNGHWFLLDMGTLINSTDNDVFVGGFIRIETRDEEKARKLFRALSLKPLDEPAICHVIDPEPLTRWKRVSNWFLGRKE